MNPTEQLLEANNIIKKNNESIDKLNNKIDNLEQQIILITKEVHKLSNIITN